MLTTLIYRSHLCKDVSYLQLEEMVAAANLKNNHNDVTGILLFNGTHFFQLLEGPEEQVQAIYQDICADTRHYNLVELLCDYAPARRFGKSGMEIFDLRRYERDDVLQTVLDRGTTKYQLTFNDRALQFFRTFVEAREKDHYYEIPTAESWEFIVDEALARYAAIDTKPGEWRFAYQPIIDPLSQEVVSIEALVRTHDDQLPESFFSQHQGEALYLADLTSKQAAFIQAKYLNIGDKTLSINLLPMTLVAIPGAVEFLLKEIAESGLVPEQIIVDFTENDIISHLDAFTSAVKQLKAAGISIAIDHFGEGHGGLLLLAEFQPDRIKINRNLIKDVHKSGPRQAIVHALIQCCASLEITVVAVGVEKAEEWMWLESAGISLFQGYLFAPPLLNGIAAIAWPEKKYEF